MQHGGVRRTLLQALSPGLRPLKWFQIDAECFEDLFLPIQYYPEWSSKFLAWHANLLLVEYQEITLFLGVGAGARISNCHSTPFLSSTLSALDAVLC